MNDVRTHNASRRLQTRFERLKQGVHRQQERLERGWQRLRLNSERRSDFYELLGNFVADGLPLFEALTEINQQYKKSREPMYLLSSMALLRLRGQAGRAYTFGHALEGHVPVVEALAISSGEEAGDPAEGLRRAALVSRSNGKILDTIREELAYPFFLFAVFALVMIGIANYAIPLFAEVLPAQHWPPVARYMATLAQATPWLLLSFAVLSSATLGFYFWRRSHWISRPRALFDRYVFPWTLHRRVTGAMLLSAMATLIHIGIPFSQILDRLSLTTGPWEALHLRRVRNRMRRGMREGDALATDLFDESMRWQITLYGRMTRFSDGLTKLAERSIDATQKSIRRSFGVLRVSLMIAISVLIVWVYSAFLAITMTAKTMG